MLRVVEAGKGVTQHLLQTEVLCTNPQAFAVFQVLCTLYLGELVPHFINTINAVEAWEGGRILVNSCSMPSFLAPSSPFERPSLWGQCYCTHLLLRRLRLREE